MGTIWRAGRESAKQRYHRNIYGFCVSIRESHQDNLQSYHQSGWNSNAESRVSKHPVGSPLPRACWRLCCGLRCLLVHQWSDISRFSYKIFFCFWKLAIAKTVLGLGIAKVVCFVSVWYERLGCICTVVVKFLVL